MRRYILAGLSITAGYVAGRPVSGRWLAHYFLGRGGERPLPPHLERKIVGLCRAVCPNGGWHQRTPHEDEDLYTCVGTFSAFRHPDGSLEYKDRYDWHALNWSFRAGPSWLPFTIDIRGRDQMFAKHGKPFLTSGIIPPGTLPDEARRSTRPWPIQDLPRHFWRRLRRRLFPREEDMWL